MYISVCVRVCIMYTVRFHDVRTREMARDDSERRLFISFCGNHFPRRRRISTGYFIRTRDVALRRMEIFSANRFEIARDRTTLGVDYGRRLPTY